jgi:hypothetical protein
VRLLAARVLDAIRDAAVCEDAEALEAERRSSAVAEESLSPLTVLRCDGHASVNVVPRDRRASWFGEYGRAGE